MVKTSTRRISHLEHAPIAHQRLVRRVLKRLISWRFRNFDPDKRHARTVRINGITLHVPSTVFDPGLHFTSPFLAGYLGRPGVVRQNARVLDMGSGTGLLAIAAARAGARRVIAVDLNPSAVKAASMNARRAGLEHVVSVLQSDMFDRLGGCEFDLVVCNPPYFRGTPQSQAQLAYMAGESLDWIYRFARGLKSHMAPCGRCLLVLGDAGEINKITKILRAEGWTVSPVARKNILVETLYIFELRSA